LYRGYYERGRSTNVQARQLLEHAIELDPDYAQAYVYLGMTAFMEWFYGWTANRPQTLAQAGGLAQKAMMLNETLADAHGLLGEVYLWQKQHDLAIREEEQAVALDPNFADGYAYLGGILGFAGRPQEGVAMVERAMRLNPRYPVLYLQNLGSVLRLAGRYEESIAVAKKILARQPNFPPAYFMLAFGYAQLGRLEEAQAAGAELQRVNPTISLEGWRRMAPFKDPALVEHDVAALRKAGLK
jgi:tetratricopeptide (TPR) repeat protein